MLTKIIMKNFKSFKNETIIDFKATGYEILNETNKTNNDILKGALFVGGNATGKSTVLQAINLLLTLMISERKVGVSSYNCLFSKGNIELSYKFEFEKEIVFYSISFNDDKIVNESLVLNDKKIINRIGNNAIYTINQEEIIISDLNENSLAARKIYFENRFNNDEILLKWFNFLENSIYVDQSAHFIQLKDALNNTYKDYFEKEGEKDFNNFLKEINYGQEVEYVHEFKGKVKFEFNNELGKPEKDLIFKRNGMNFALPISMESEGNKTLINMFSCVLKVMKTPSMILIDEFSSGFHNKLEESVIKYFMKYAKNSQMFLVSHSTNLMNNSILRPDQIYTVDFIEKEGSKIYRVSDEKPREAQNLEKMYLNGVFNGLPDYK